MVARCANAVTRFTRLDVFSSWENHTASMELRKEKARANTSQLAIEIFHPGGMRNPIHPRILSALNAGTEVSQRKR